MKARARLSVKVEVVSGVALSTQLTSYCDARSAARSAARSSLRMRSFQKPCASIERKCTGIQKKLKIEIDRKHLGGGSAPPSLLQRIREGAVCQCVHV